VAFTNPIGIGMNAERELSQGELTMPLEELDLVAIDMGYGHLRPAQALSDFIGDQPILLADRPPLASPDEQRLWKQARTAYELLSRASALPVAGPMLSEVLRGVTSIAPLYPRRDLSPPTVPTRLLAHFGQRGMGRGLTARLQRGDRILLTTFFGPAVLSDLAGCERLYCVVTDSDVNRVWARPEAGRTNVVYLAPTERVRRRLKTYGVPSDRILVTGFPLPHRLVGGPGAPDLKQNLRRRLAALDPRGRFLRECRDEVAHFLGETTAPGKPVHLAFAVGGAGAQSEMVERFLPSLAKRLRRGKMRLTLIAGVRQEVAQVFRDAVAQAGLTPELDDGTISILLADSHPEYFAKFDELLESVDVLWTKPSELTFYGALGLPLILSSPVGSHERYNARWALHSGAAVRQSDPRHAGDWLWEMLKDGTLAGAAWTGYMRMPKFGLYRIIEEVLGPPALERLLGRGGSLSGGVSSLRSPDDDAPGAPTDAGLHGSVSETTTH